MTRSVEEWVAPNDDAAIPTRVKLRIWERCGGRCAISGRKLHPGEYDFDHIIALANGGSHTEANLQVIGKDAHKTKTADDIGLTAKIRRQSLKDKGLWPKSKAQLRGRKFDQTRRVPSEGSV